MDSNSDYSVDKECSFREGFLVRVDLSLLWGAGAACRAVPAVKLGSSPFQRKPVTSGFWQYPGEVTK